MGFSDFRHSALSTSMRSTRVALRAGTQQAASGGEELDGFDEVFLPADAGARVDSRGRIPNGIVDDEIGQRLAAIRASHSGVSRQKHCRS